MWVMQRKAFRPPGLWSCEAPSWTWVSLPGGGCPLEESTGDTAEDGNFICLPELPKMLQLQGIYSRKQEKDSKTEVTRALLEHPSFYKPN